MLIGAQEAFLIIIIINYYLIVMLKTIHIFVEAMMHILRIICMERTKEHLFKIQYFYKSF